MNNDIMFGAPVETELAVKDVNWIVITSNDPGLLSEVDSNTQLLREIIENDIRVFTYMGVQGMVYFRLPWTTRRVREITFFFYPEHTSIAAMFKLAYG